MSITETRLIHTNKFNIKGYTVHREDRPIQTHVPAGGVAVLVKNNIPHTRVHLPHTNLETVCVRLSDNTHFISTYNKPSQNFTINDIHTLLNISGKVLLLGDLNAKHPTWNCNIANANGRTLHSYALNHNCIILHPPNPTHYPANNMTPTTIDIYVNKNINNITDPIALPELNSDHLPILSKMYTNIKHEETKHYTRSYKNTDWTKFRKTLDTLITINRDINTPQELEQAVHTFTHAVTQAIHKHTSIIKLDMNKDKLPVHITALITQRNNTRKLWQRSRDPALRPIVNSLTQQIRSQIKSFRNKSWTDKITALNPNDNSLWRLSKNLKNPFKPIPDLIQNNITLLTDEQKAEALAETFERVHNLDPNHTAEQQAILETVNEFLNTPHHPSRSTLSKLFTKPLHIIDIIKSFPNQKAPGPDTIQNIVLKNLTRKAIVQLTYIINTIIKLSHFPPAWKMATIIPISKPNKNPKLPTSYRPISLLCTLSKVAEKVILSRIQKFDSRHNITPSFQFGFRPKHNTVQQVARIVTDISLNYNKNNVTVMALFDVEKAFDRVWKEGLIYKMIRANFPPVLTNLINSYLTNRKLRVKVNNKLSTPRTITAGIAQGSCLGPKLFTIFMHDIPTFPKTQTALYADDTAIYAHSFSAEVANKQLQIHLNILQPYWSHWKISINHDKTKTIVFSRKFTNTKVYTPLTLHNHRTTPSQSVKYLGVTLTHRLNYHHHFQNSIKKAFLVVKSLYPLLSKNSQMSIKNKKLVYTTIIRPILTYAAPVWCSASKTALLPLQRFQNKCLRLINSADRYTRIADLHNTAELPYLHDYINQMSQKFYVTQTQHNPLTKNITKVREHNAPFRLKHPLPYQTLPLFYQRTPEA